MSSNLSKVHQNQWLIIIYGIFSLIGYDLLICTTALLDGTEFDSSRDKGTLKFSISQVLKVNVLNPLDSLLKGVARGSTLAPVDAGLEYCKIGKKDEGLEMYKPFD